MNNALNPLSAILTLEKSQWLLFCSLAFVLLLQPVGAQEEPDSEAPENFMEALIEQSGMSAEELEASGFTPEMMEQVNQAMQESGAMDYGAAAQQAEQDKKQAKFDALTEGFGNARVSFDGAEHVLPITQCEYYDDEGSFAIRAQNSRHPESGLLSIISQSSGKESSAPTPARSSCRSPSPAASR